MISAKRKIHIAKSRWYSREQAKCFRDVRFSVCARGKEGTRYPRGSTLYIDTCQRASSRLFAMKLGFLSGARSDSR